MKRLCVYCGSSPGTDPAYINAAEALAEEMVSRNIGLVYGGASVGIMGAVARAVMRQGGEVIGIIPHALMRLEIGNDHCSELQIVDSMHERKAAMADQSDGFVALPGGMGTLEEIFEILTWAQLGFHQKPCALLNVNNYYDSLLDFLQHSVDEGFLKPNHHQLLQTHTDPANLLNHFQNFSPAPREKWIDQASQL